MIAVVPPVEERPFQGRVKSAKQRASALVLPGYTNSGIALTGLRWLRKYLKSRERQLIYWAEILDP